MEETLGGVCSRRSAFLSCHSSRSSQPSRAAASPIGRPRVSVLGRLDVTDQASIAAAAERVRNELGRLDVLVNNAAIANTRLRLGESVEEDAREPVRLALLGREGPTGTFSIAAGPIPW